MTVRRFAPTIALGLVTVVTAVSMVRVFAGWDFLADLLIVALVAHGVAALLRVGRVPGVVAVPLGLGLVVALVSLMRFPGTQWALLPTATTAELARSELAEAWTQVGVVVPPVSSSGGFGLAAALALGIAAVAADAFAFRAHGRVEALVPCGVVFVAVSAVGIDRNRVAVTMLWLLAALLYVALARAADALELPGWVGQRTGGAWVRWVAGGATLAVVASLAAGVVGPRLPGAGAEPLLDPEVRDGDGVTEVLSPLVDIRGRLVNQSDTVLFTVTSPAAQYWRLSGLPEFDGRVWGLPDRELDEAAGQLDRAQPFGTPLVQQYRIQALGGNLAPVAFTPTELRSTSIDLFFVTSTSTLVVTGRGLRPGNTYEIVSSASAPPLDALLSATSDAPPDPVYLDLPTDWSDDLTATARQIVGGETRPYGQARLLQDWFRDNFTYTLDVPSGHSVRAIEEFIERGSGYCEQFAGTFAAFARSLGLPARVAVGFTTGERGGDGNYRVRSRHAHAWPEVWFDDVGWVIFEPTPGRGAPGTEDYTGVPAQQDDTVAADPDDPVVVSTTTVPAGTPGSAPPTTTPAVEDIVVGDATTAPPASSGGSPLGRVLLLAAALVGLWAWLMPLATARRRASQRTSRDQQVVDTWNATVAALELAGVPIEPSDTPAEAARRIARQTGIDRHELAELASATTHVVYGAHPLDDQTVERCLTVGRHVLDSARQIVPRSRRLQARLDPRLAGRLCPG
jgi:transglutaminase-like putative cysteine protease